MDNADHYYSRPHIAAGQLTSLIQQWNMLIYGLVLAELKQDVKITSLIAFL